MKKRRGAEKIVAKLHHPDVDLGKGRTTVGLARTRRLTARTPRRA